MQGGGKVHAHWWNRLYIPYYQIVLSDLVHYLHHCIHGRKHYASQLINMKSLHACISPSRLKRCLSTTAFQSLQFSSSLPLSCMNKKDRCAFLCANRTAAVSTDQRTEPPCDFLICVLGIEECPLLIVRTREASLSVIRTPVLMQVC
jgi:hypothetical protein